MRGCDDFLKGALGHDAPAERPGSRTDIDDMVGRRDGVVVVFDHKDRVAEVAQAFKGGDEAFVVALVKSDTGFVEHVEDPGQAAADLRGQADALGLAAGKGAAFTIQGEVVESDLFEKGEAAGDFAHHFAGDRLIVALQPELSDDLCRAGDGEITKSVDGIFLSGRGDQSDAKNFGAETGSAAADARTTVLQGFEALLQRLALGAGQQMLELREEAFERLG